MMLWPVRNLWRLTEFEVTPWLTCGYEAQVVVRERYGEKRDAAHNKSDVQHQEE